MSTYCIKTTLMQRDGMTEAAALERINEVVEDYQQSISNPDSDADEGYDDLEELLREEFQLEPDYMLDLLDYLN